MGFDGLISASSSGSSQNILLQDLCIVFQNALFVSTVHGGANVKKIGFDYQKNNIYLYSRLRDGNGCAARTVEPECLMPSK